MQVPTYCVAELGPSSLVQTLFPWVFVKAHLVR